MKKTCILFLLLLYSGLAHAQAPQSGNLTATSTDCSKGASCVTLNIDRNVGAVSVQVTGIFSATLSFEATVDGTNWVAINGDPVPSASAATSTTSTGAWIFNVAGLQSFRVRASAYTSGTAAVSVRPSTAFAKNRSFGTLAVASLNNIRYANQFAGADAGAKITACIADLPSTGGTCDARGLEGAQSAASTITIDKSVTLLLGAGTLTMTANPGISVTSLGVEIVGVDSRTTILNYTPSGTGTAIKFSAGASELFQTAIRHLYISSTDTTNTKTALEVVDVSDWKMEDVIVHTWSGSNSIGLLLKGRELVNIEEGAIYADIPVRISANPNRSDGSLDAANFKDTLLVAPISGATQPVILVDSGAILTQVVFDGGAWIGGTYGLYWVDTTSTVSSVNMRISDLRWEQQSDANGWFVYIDKSGGGASSMEQLAIQRVSTGAGASANGIYLRNTHFLSIDDYQYGSTSKTGLEIGSSTVKNVRLNNCEFNTGSTVTIAGATDVVAQYSVGGGSMVAGAIDASVASSGEVGIWGLRDTANVNRKLYFGIDNTLGASGKAYIQSTLTGTSTIPLQLNPLGGRVEVPLVDTKTNCADSAGDAACGDAPAGAFVIDAADTNTVVSTTAVTANSQIFLQVDSSLGTRLGVTCNTQDPGTFDIRVTARTAATSFTVTADVGPTTNPLCVNYFIVN